MSKKSKSAAVSSTASSFASIASSFATMSSSLSTPACIYSRGSVTDDALDTHREILKQAALKAGCAVTMEIFEVRSAFKGKNKRKADVFDDMELVEFLENPNGIHDLFVVSEDRLARNTVLTGTILSLCKRNRITIHIVGVGSPYKFVPSTGEGEQRLWIALLDAVKESEEKSERAIRSAQHRSLLRSLLPPRPYEPPFVSEKMLELLTLMINGCPIEVFYKTFNEMLEKNPEQKERYGGEWIFADDNGVELTIIKKNDINLSRMLKTFSQWELCRENKYGKMLKQKWTRATLGEVISHHFGGDVLERVGKKWDEFSDDENEDKEKDEEMGDAVQVAAQPAVSGRVPHADIIGHRDTCGGCGAKMMHVGQRWCHDCGARLV